MPLLQKFAVNLRPRYYLGHQTVANYRMSGASALGTGQRHFPARAGSPQLPRTRYVCRRVLRPFWAGELPDTHSAARRDLGPLTPTWAPEPSIVVLSRQMAASGQLTRFI